MLQTRVYNLEEDGAHNNVMQEMPVSLMRGEYKVYVCRSGPFGGSSLRLVEGVKLCCWSFVNRRVWWDNKNETTSTRKYTPIYILIRWYRSLGSFKKMQRR